MKIKDLSALSESEHQRWASRTLKFVFYIYILVSVAQTNTFQLRRYFQSRGLCVSVCRDSLGETLKQRSVCVPVLSEWCEKCPPCCRLMFVFPFGKQNHMKDFLLLLLVPSMPWEAATRWSVSWPTEGIYLGRRRRVKPAGCSVALGEKAEQPWCRDAPVPSHQDAASKSKPQHGDTTLLLPPAGTHSIKLMNKT